MHKLFLYTKPRTACGIKVLNFYPQSNKSMIADGSLIYVTTIDQDVTCEECLKHIKKNKGEK